MFRWVSIIVFPTSFNCFIIVFYIPDPSAKSTGEDKNEKRKLKTLIEKYGGMLSEFHECFTYQIEPISDTLTPKHFFHGDVY